MLALIDCNNFYASCERVFQPSLRNKPVAILSNNDGCVVARSQEVKDLGVPMGAPFFKWKDHFKKHGVQVFSSNYTLYGDMSFRVMETIKSFAPEIEIYSIDEAFVDLSSFPDPLAKAQEIYEAVYKNTGIPVCIGIAKTKVLAKAANRVAKKFKLGVHMADEKNHKKLLNWLKVEDVWGIGKSYTQKLRSYNIHTAAQLIEKPDDWIQKQLTIVGLRIVYELRGMACLPFEFFQQPKKNIVCSRSFGELVTTYEKILEASATHASRAGEKLRKQSSVAQQITVFIETNSFREKDAQYANSKAFSFSQATSSSSELIKGVRSALEFIYKDGYNYKKCGVMVSGLLPANEVQYDLFSPIYKSKHDSICKAMDLLNFKYDNKVSYAACGVKKEWEMKRDLKSRHYTTNWKELMIV